MVQVFSLDPWDLCQQLLGQWTVWLYQVLVMPIRTQDGASAAPSFSRCVAERIELASLSDLPALFTCSFGR
jgi:hypothetical protein